MSSLTEDNKFKSDKYEWCPEGFFAIKLSDPIGRLCLLTYAELTDQTDLARDLRLAIEQIEKEEYDSYNK